MESHVVCHVVIDKGLVIKHGKNGPENRLKAGV